MPTLLEIQSALEAGNQVIDAENPYSRFGNTADQISQLFVQSADKDNLKEAIIGSALTGLISGGLSGLGNNYKVKKQTEYQDVLKNLLSGNENYQNANISKALFGQAKNVSDLLKMTEASRQEEDERAIKRSMGASAVESAFRNPNTASNFLKKEYKIDNFEPMEATEATASDLSALNSLEPLSVNQQKELFNEYLNTGYTPSQASQAVAQLQNAKIAQAKELQKEQIENYKDVIEAGKKGKKLKQMSLGLEKALSEAGNTGFGGGVAQSVAGLLGSLGLQGQKKKYAGGQNVESYGADIVNLAREAGTGPMTDQDAQRYLKSGVNLSQSEETNKEILKRTNYIADLQNAYAKHMSEARKLNLPVYEAEQTWSDIVAENPYFVRDLETGNLIENPNWQAGISGQNKAEATAPTALNKITPSKIIQKRGKDGKMYNVEDLGNGNFRILE